MEEYGDEFFTFLKSVNIKMKPIRLLGRGVQGEVYLICYNNSEDDCKVVKVVYLTMNFEYEVNMQRKFYDIGLAPKVIKAAMFVSKPNKKYGAIIMDRVDSTLESILKIERNPLFLDHIVDELINIIKKLCNHNLVHGDMYFGNVAYHKNHVSLIDFGRSCCVVSKDQCEPKFELARLLSSCFSKRNNEYNGIYLADQLQKKAKTEFNIKFYDNQFLGSINAGESKIGEKILQESYNLYFTKVNDFKDNTETSKIDFV
jgi:hypothetical protein